MIKEGHFIKPIFKKEIGFSVKREYPEINRFKPPIKKDGKPDVFALVGILYEPERCDQRKPRVVPISAKISVFSKYISKNWDYDFSDNECPTEESVIASKKTPKPVDLSAFDQYAYDHDNDVFLDADGNTLEGISIIDGLYEDHLATVDTFKGLVFRWKLASRSKTGAVCETVRGILKWFLRTVCGRTLESDEMMRGIWGSYRPEDMRLLKTERIDVFGYKASKNVIVTFCTLLLLGYSFFHWTSLSSSWISGVANNSLLAFAFSIVLISILDNILPKVFLWLINGLNRLRWKMLSVSVKFK